MKTWKTLGYMGLIPFVLCLYLSGHEMFWGIDPKQAFIAYSAVILSFIAGTLWQVNGPQQSYKQKSKQQIISNFFSLIAFVSLLINPYVALAILTTSYLLHFLYEVRLVLQDELNPEYITMRFRLTLTVILLHITAFIVWSN